ncbi:MAG: clostripain-related cysteine peptidase, partial [Planctomycetota bacterium]
ASKIGFEISNDRLLVSDTEPGDTQTLVDFFRWAKQPIEETDKIAVIFTGLGVGDKQSIVGNLETDFGRVFSICDDNSSRDALSPMEVTEGIEVLVTDYRGGEPIDVLGFDMSSMQFVEVAYQFMGLAHTMVASQNNSFDPFWPYAELVRATARRVAGNEYVGPSDVGSVFVEEIGRKQETGNTAASSANKGSQTDERPVVSAIELGHLDVVARSLDTFLLNLLQLLGDDAIWLMREMVFRDMRRAHQRFAKYRAGAERELIAYDLRHMLLTVEYHLEQIQDAHGVLKTWCDNELRKIYDPEKGADAFSRVGPPDTDSTHFKAELEKRTVRDGVWSFVWERMGRKEKDEKAGGAVSGLEESRLWRLLKLVSFKDEVPYCPFLDAYEASGMSARDASSITENRGDRFDCDRATRASLVRLKDHFDRLTPAQLDRSAAAARHLLQVTKDVISLIAPPPLDEDSSLIGFRRAPFEQDDQSKTGCIVAYYSRHPNAFAEPERADADGSQEYPLNDCDRRLAERAPVYCGVSIFRPEHLGRIAESRYLDFSFHRRVHWVSLLAAINLIRNHPGQLWHLVSSLLSTCTGSGRDELLQRLAGPSSVMDHFGNQFRALQNPLTFTLTVTEDRSELSRARINEQASNESDSEQSSAAETAIQFDDLVTYILRLETNRQDAFVDTGVSSVNRRRVRQALDRLEEIVAPKGSKPRGADSLEDFARDLGEDIFQGIDLHLRREESDSIPHLQLQLPVELMGLPWEVMNEGRLT